MKKLSLIFLFLITIQASFADKHALIIAVGDYPKSTGWSSISSVNDVPLIKGALLNQGFLEKDIITLINEQATKQGILDALARLQSQLKPGDIVVIHYSGHGQQIFDDNGDEIDDKDESLVPIDAWVRYTHNYKGENHLRDDELHNIITNLRNTLGQDGQLLMILDSCHSGSATRGGITRGGEATFAPENWKAKDQDDSTGSAMLEREKVSDTAAPFVMISGASANELNYEYDGVGSLSYAFSKAMNELGSDFTYRQLFSNIAANMNVISPKQKPTIEGDIDYKLFKGDYVKQQPYFEVTKIPTSTVIQINGGKLQRLFNNTTVYVMPAGTTKVDEGKALAKGTISNAKFNESFIKLNKPLTDRNEKNYWVFIDKPTYGDISIQVYLEPDTDTEIQKSVASFLDKNGLGSVVNDTLKADVVISKTSSGYTLNSAKGLDVFDATNKQRGTDVQADLNNKLFNYAQGMYLKNLSLKNYDYEFDFKLLPVEYVAEIGELGARLPEDSYNNSEGILEVRPGIDHVLLEVTNKSNRPLYFSLIEINSKGEIAPFMPNNKCRLTNDDRKLAPGKTMIFKECVYRFGPPYERLILKGFATDSPINFQSTVETRGERTRSTNNNPLENFIKNSYTQSRGSEGTEASGNMDGYSTEFVYEIVKE
ncbi:Caspase domain-containing protein [Bizionia echini]|uniref:Caspase domain-containing protein n=1 Tax=Bizionia echini TaxID=649333 RepID=A0A1I5C4G8_9FLAO|nr:caspase family protein [Bizionia echini]SFN81702.1 Caspase domain-containing protein [Bizionia echini]